MLGWLLAAGWCPAGLGCADEGWTLAALVGGLQAAVGS